jgi:hypothetical protein
MIKDNPLFHRMPMLQRAPLNPQADPPPRRLPVLDPVLAGDPEGAVRALMATGMPRWDAMVALLGAGVDPWAFVALRGLPKDRLRAFPDAQEAMAAFHGIHREDSWGANAALNAYLEGRTVEGNLSLTPFTWVEGLPAGLVVRGHLHLGPFHLSRARPWATLPEGLRVGGGLFLRGTQLATLPKGLWVGGVLAVFDCPSWDGRIPGDAEVGLGIETDRHPNLPLAEWRQAYPHGEGG